jgi:Beta-ketoacyl synthase, N-terminal domain
MASASVNSRKGLILKEYGVHGPQKNRLSGLSNGTYLNVAHPNETHLNGTHLNGTYLQGSQAHCVQANGATHLEDDKLEAIAVIGLALRFPQDATSAESFWQMLVEGRSAMTEVPKERFNIDAFHHSGPKKANVV